MPEEELSERCPTGIKGFDKLIEGGFPRGRTILLAGESGTGKTIFATEFLCRGAERYNEPGVLVMLEQDPAELKKDLKSFNFNFEKLVESEKIKIIDASLSKRQLGDLISSKTEKKGVLTLLPAEREAGKLADIIIKTARGIGAKRVIVDSVPALNIVSEDPADVREILLNMNYKLKNAHLTTILISELSEYRDILTRGIESYIVDGIITLHYSASGELAGRTLIIKKMRSTHHSENIHPIQFVRGEGVVISDV